MQKFNVSIAAFVLTAAGANAQLVNYGSFIEINTNTGAGSVVNQTAEGEVTPTSNALTEQLYYYGTYLNPRVDETAITANGFAYTFTTNSTPVELTSIKLSVDQGRTVNSGGPFTGSDLTSNVTVNAKVDEVLSGGELLDTGYLVSIDALLSGNGIVSFDGANAGLALNYILRPDTTYALELSIADVMTFSNTANDPSMGVTQEFNDKGTGIKGTIQFLAAPEPPAFAGLGFGLLGFACLRRRRK